MCVCEREREKREREREKRREERGRERAQHLKEKNEFFSPQFFSSSFFSNSGPVFLTFSKTSPDFKRSGVLVFPVSFSFFFYVGDGFFGVGGPVEQARG